MAALSSALNYAIAGLSVSTTQSALVARNVSSAGDDNYVRRSADISVLPFGMPAVARISRNADRQLLDRLLTAESSAAGHEILLAGLNRMSALVGDPESDLSVASSISRLQQSLKRFEATPSSIALSHDVLRSAKEIAQRLNSGFQEINAIRNDASKGLASSVEQLSSLLDQFKILNDSVVRGQGTPDELMESLDQRDSVLKLISEEIGIRTVIRTNNDIVIYTESGVTLFEGSPRDVIVTNSTTPQSESDSSTVKVDGVAVTGASAPMALSNGRIAAYAKLRDSIAMEVSQQFDEIAAGLVRAFSENGPPSAVSLPPAEGLFRADGSVPSLAERNEGLAGRLRINELADPDLGGKLSFLRDGGFGGEDYIENTAGYPGFQSRIAELVDSIDLIQPFEARAGIGGDVSVRTLSLQSISWIEATRQNMSSTVDASQAAAQRTSDALARVTGVNIDIEMATLMDLEKSFQASSRVLIVVDAMLASLLEAVS
jgi:flagellar hook-associated protein 1 FlgK